MFTQADVFAACLDSRTCQTRQRTPLKAGDQVEVLGFPGKGEYTPVLQDATYRKTGEAALPAPVLLDVDGVLAGTHDCQLVQIVANLLERTERGRERFLVLEKDGFIFNAFLGQDIASGIGFPAMRNGSEVALTGVCLIERGANWRDGESWRRTPSACCSAHRRRLSFGRLPPGGYSGDSGALWGSCASLSLPHCYGYRSCTGASRRTAIRQPDAPY